MKKSLEEADLEIELVRQIAASTNPPVNPQDHGKLSDRDMSFETFHRCPGPACRF
jgi:hypothetical protein